MPRRLGEAEAWRECGRRIEAGDWEACGLGVEASRLCDGEMIDEATRAQMERRVEEHMNEQRRVYGATARGFAYGENPWASPPRPLLAAPRALACYWLALEAESEQSGRRHGEGGR